MAMKVRYSNFNGELAAEKRDGVRRQYLPDSIGNTIALLDNTQAKTDTFQYWPYGEERTRAGTTPTPFRYVGVLGYYRDTGARSHVRARDVDTAKGRWLTCEIFGPVPWELASPDVLERYH